MHESFHDLAERPRFIGSCSISTALRFYHYLFPILHRMERENITRLFVGSDHCFYGCILAIRVSIQLIFLEVSYQQIHLRQTPNRMMYSSKSITISQRVQRFFVMEAWKLLFIQTQWDFLNNSGKNAKNKNSFISGHQNFYFLWW